MSQTLRRRADRLEAQVPSLSATTYHGCRAIEILEAGLGVREPTGHREPSPVYPKALVWVQDDPGVPLEQVVIPLRDRIAADAMTPADIALIESLDAEFARFGDNFAGREFVVAMARFVEAY